MPETYSIKQLLDKTFFAKKKVAYYRRPGEKAIGYFKAGSIIGNLYSYVTKSGILYFMFYDKNKKPFYIKNNPGSGELDLNALIKQGVKNEVQEAKEKEGADLWSKSKLEYFIKKYGLWVFAAIGAVLLLKKSNNASR
jgi:hypothetical protein